MNEDKQQIVLNDLPDELEVISQSVESRIQRGQEQNLSSEKSEQRSRKIKTIVRNGQNILQREQSPRNQSRKKTKTYQRGLTAKLTKKLSILSSGNNSKEDLSFFHHDFATKLQKCQKMDSRELPVEIQLKLSEELLENKKKIEEYNEIQKREQNREFKRSKTLIQKLVHRNKKENIISNKQHFLEFVKQGLQKQEEHLQKQFLEDLQSQGQTERTLECDDPFEGHFQGDYCSSIGGYSSRTSLSSDNEYKTAIKHENRKSKKAWEKEILPIELRKKDNLEQFKQDRLYDQQYKEITGMRRKTKCQEIIFYC